MKKQSRLPLFVMASSAFLPYAVVTTGTEIGTTNQYWLFPFWRYVHDFGVWLGPGRIIPPFASTYPLPLLFLGWLWCALGFYTGWILRLFYARQIEAKIAWFSTLIVLVFQTIMTIPIVSVAISNRWNIPVIPLPIQTIIVIALLTIEIRRVDSNLLS